MFVKVALSVSSAISLSGSLAGAFIGGVLLPASEESRIGTGKVVAILSATIGAVMLLTLLRYLKRT